MKSRTTSLILGAALVLAATTPQSFAQTTAPSGKPAAATGVVAVPRTDTLNPEVAPPVTPSGSLNPEVHIPTVPAVPSVPLVNDTLNPTGAVPSVPVDDPSKLVLNPNEQSEVSGPAAVPVPGQIPPPPPTGGSPPVNVNTGMHSPALGPKMNGAAQAAH